MSPIPPECFLSQVKRAPGSTHNPKPFMLYIAFVRVFILILLSLFDQIEDEVVLRLLYEEAKSNILTGRYPCDPEHWTSLGALSLALEEGSGLESQKLTTTIK